MENTLPWKKNQLNRKIFRTPKSEEMSESDNTSFIIPVIMLMLKPSLTEAAFSSIWVYRLGPIVGFRLSSLVKIV